MVVLFLNMVVIIMAGMILINRCKLLYLSLYRMKIIRKLLTNKNITFLGIFLIVIVASSMIIPSNFMEGYQNISASNKPILDNFQYTGNKKVGN